MQCYLQSEDIPQNFIERGSNVSQPSVEMRSPGDEEQESGHHMSSGEQNDRLFSPFSSIGMMNGLGQQGDYQWEANGLLSGQEFSPPSSEMHHFADNRSCQRPTHQQEERRQENGLPNALAHGGISDEPSFFAEAASLPPDATAVRDEPQLLEPCAGEEALEVFHPIQMENLVSDQRIELPEQPTYQQGYCAVHNGLSSPTQETAVHDASPLHERPMVCPLQDSRQDLRVSCLVQGTSELQLLSGCDDGPRCGQQTNHFQVNGVSSLGETEQAIEHSCDMQELRLWENAIIRQVSNL